MTAKSIGLVLTGGGSRAAYQAGALKGISEILGSASPRIPFSTISGISAGAINAAFLASKADHFYEGVESACALWANIHSKQVLEQGVFSVARLAMKWLRDLVFGGLVHGERANHLLNTDPLQKHLLRVIDFGAIQRHFKSGALHGLAVSVTDYRDGRAVSFFDGDASIEPWSRSARRGERTKIHLPHVLASAAIPVLFQPVPIEESTYGDGSVALKSPLSPAIHMGARKILAIGIRHPRASPMAAPSLKPPTPVNLIDIAGLLLNMILMDSFESDVERLERINQTLEVLEREGHESELTRLHKIELLSLHPSRDLGVFATDQFRKFPWMLRHLLRGLGASEAKGRDLLSYLSFDSSYTVPIMELGHADALARREEIRAFFEA